MKKFLLVIIPVVIFVTSLSAEWEHQLKVHTKGICFEWNNLVYVGGQNGILELNIATGERKHISMLNADIPSNYINSFLKFGDGTVLIATNRGLGVFKNGTFTTKHPIVSSYPGNDARLLYPDYQGNVWTFSDTKVYRYSNGEWKTYDIQSYIDTTFEVIGLLVRQNEVWALFSTGYNFYNPGFGTSLYVKVAILNDTGIKKFFLTKDDFPYTPGMVYAADADDKVIWFNYDGVYVYENDEWKMSKILDTLDYAIFTYNGLVRDSSGNIWYIVINLDDYGSYPVSYNIKTGQKTIHLSSAGENISYVKVTNGGIVVAYHSSASGVYFKKNGEWIRKSREDLGILESEFITSCFGDGNKIFVELRAKDYKRSGTLVEITENRTFPPLVNGYPFWIVTQIEMNRDGQAFFGHKSGLFSHIGWYYQADSGLVNFRTFIGATSIQCKLGTDGYVYIKGKQETAEDDYFDYVSTWKGNDFKSIYMGVPGRSSYFVNFDVDGNKLVGLSEYQYSSTDSAYSALLNVYDLNDGTFTRYDKFNGNLPGFYIKGGYVHDTIPYDISTGSSGEWWILFTVILENDSKLLLMEFTTDGIKYYSIPFKGIVAFLYDKFTRQLVFPSKQYIYFFDTNTEIVDSVEFAMSGLIGVPIAFKKLFDGNVYACDSLGHLYKYIGNGHFEPIDLKIYGKPNLGFAINDFSLDANYNLHLATEVGLLSSNEIITDVMDKTEKFDESRVVYPNPASDFVYFNNPELQPVRIYSALGIQIAEISKTRRIDVSSLSPGLYFIRVGSEVYKFIKW